MKRIIYILCFCFLLLCITSCEDMLVENNPNIFINEICTNNGSFIPTKDNKYVDWIELYNDSDSDVFLKNYGISDEKNNMYKFTMPSVYIKAKSFLIIFFDNDEIDEQLHGEFGLSASGETIYLTMPNGTLLNEINVPKLDLNTSYGLYNGSYEVINPSPNEVNETKPVYQYIEAPSFNFESGFYDSEFELELTTNSNAKIYYTLDSSIPTTNSILYDKPITVVDPSENDNVLKSRDDMSIFDNNIKDPVDKMFVIRAIAISDDGNKSKVITKNYFVNKDYYKDYKIVSLVTEESNLTDGEKGIYVKGDAYTNWENAGSEGEAPDYNWDQDGRISERDCNLTYIDNGNYSFNQDCGMRIHGYGGRSIFYKSFNIYARSNYGEKYFKSPIFDAANQTKSFILKYDRYSATNEKFKDGFVQSLVSDRNVSIQDYEQCIVFLNGEYWQTYSIMQKYSEEYLEDTYGVDKDNVVIIKDSKLDVGTKEDFNDYRELEKFVKTTDFSVQENYEKFKKMVDVESFIDYYAINLYINNFDWSYRKNYLLWKTRDVLDDKYSDGKWRYMMYDNDYVAANKTLTYKEETVTYDYKFDPFTGTFLYATDFKDDIFFHKLMQNEEFKELFIQTFFDLANYNFNYTSVRNKMKDEYNVYTGVMITFFKNRFTYIKDHLANYLNCDNTVVLVKIDTEKTIMFNTLTISNDYEGYYFTDTNLSVKGVSIDELILTDLEVVSASTEKIVLKITGYNPNIKMK